MNTGIKINTAEHTKSFPFIVSMIIDVIAEDALPSLDGSITSIIMTIQARNYKLGSVRFFFRKIPPNGVNHVMRVAKSKNLINTIL